MLQWRKIKNAALRPQARILSKAFLCLYYVHERRGIIYENFDLYKNFGKKFEKGKPNPMPYECTFGFGLPALLFVKLSICALNFLIYCHAKRIF